MVRVNQFGAGAAILAGLINAALASADPPATPDLIPQYCAGLQTILADPWAEFSRRKQSTIDDCVQVQGNAALSQCTQQADTSFTPRALDQMTKTAEEEWKKLGCKSKV